MNPLNNKLVFVKDISGRGYNCQSSALTLALHNLNDKELILWLKASECGDEYHDLPGCKLTIVNES